MVKKRRLSTINSARKSITPRPLDLNEPVESGKHSPLVMGFIIGFVLLVIFLAVYNFATSTSDFVVSKTITTDLPSAPLSEYSKGTIDVKMEKPVLEAPPPGQYPGKIDL